MTSTTITSFQHPLVKQANKLASKRGRKELGEILVETIHPVAEALKAGLTPHHIFIREDFNWPLTDVILPQELITVVETEVMRKLGTTDSAPPIAAIFKHPSLNKTASENSKIQAALILDEIQDPGNAGTLIRTSVAFGYDALITTEGTVDCYSPKVIRSSAGLVFRLPIIAIDQFNLDSLTLYITDLNQKSQPLTETQIKKPFGIVLGNEAHGIGEQFKSLQNTQSIYIPMASNVDSLNVGISGSILMHTFNNL